MNMKGFFEVLEEHSDAAISIAFYVYMLADCITSHLRKKKIIREVKKKPLHGTPYSGFFC